MANGYCSKCGGKLEEKASFCLYCGESIETSPSQASPLNFQSAVTAKTEMPLGSFTKTAKKDDLDDILGPSDGIEDRFRRRLSERTPEKGSPYEVLGVWKWVGTCIVLGLPLVGFIMTLVWGIGGKNLARRNFCRALLILLLIGVLLSVVGFFVLPLLGADRMLTDLTDVSNEMIRWFSTFGS